MKYSIFSKVKGISNIKIMFFFRQIFLYTLNVLWWFSCLGDWVTFRRQCNQVKKTQIRILRQYTQLLVALKGLTKTEKDTELLAKFRELPLKSYAEFTSEINQIRNGEIRVLTNDPVVLLEPTGGSTSGSKLIPYNQTFRQEYQQAINPWIADLFFRFPRLFGGVHYWSISPNTEFKDGKSSKVPIGFADDSEYLGGMRKIISRILLAVPSEISKVSNIRAFEYLTLLFLVKEKNLRLISVWHPSFLSILLAKLPEYWPEILVDIAEGKINSSLELPEELKTHFNRWIHPDKKRARTLNELDITDPSLPGKIWTKLQVLSCWGEGISALWLPRLSKAFPGVIIQPKGLLATEGAVTFPFGPKQQQVLAVNSHFFEFLETTTGEMKFAWEVEIGKIYQVILTTGSGLCRYQLQDQVEVTDFFKQVPVLRFLGREKVFSDLAGEKLHSSQTDKMIADLQKEFNLVFDFAMVVPTPLTEKENAVGKYIFFLYAPKMKKNIIPEMEKSAENKLCHNYHYQHARNLGQLQHISIVPWETNPEATIQTYFRKKGQQLGDIKICSLISDPGILEVLKPDENAIGFIND